MEVTSPVAVLQKTPRAKPQQICYQKVSQLNDLRGTTDVLLPQLVPQTNLRTQNLRTKGWSRRKKKQTTKQWSRTQIDHQEKLAPEEARILQNDLYYRDPAHPWSVRPFLVRKISLLEIHKAGSRRDSALDIMYVGKPYACFSSAVLVPLRWAATQARMI